MNISFITATLTSGGSERVVSLLANQLQQRGHQVEIVLLMEPIVFYQTNEQVKLLFVEKEVDSTSMLKKMIWLRKYVRSHRPDVVIPFMIPVYLTTLLALLGLNVPIITSERNDPASFSWFRKVMRSVLLPTTTCHVVQTQQIKAYYSKRIQQKTEVIYNPVTEDVFKVKQVEREYVMINVARLFPQKNQQLLLEAFNYIKKDIPEWNLKIFGEGPERDSLELRIKQLGLESRVFLCGRSNHVLEEMNKSRLFVLSSNNEGMSNAMIEAICLGLPVVTTRVSGTDELVSHGENGLLSEVGDVKQLAANMLLLAKNPKMRQQMGEAGKRKARLFKMDTIVDQWERLIKSVVKTRSE